MQLTRNTLWNVAEAGTGFVVSIVIAREFVLAQGVVHFGLFTLLSLLASYGLLSLFDLGMTGAVVTFAARYRALGQLQQLRRLWGFALLYFPIVAALASAVAASIVWFDIGGIWTRIRETGYGPEVVLPALALVFFSLLGFLGDSFFRAFEGFRTLQTVNILSHAIRLAGIVGLVYRPSPLPEILWMLLSVAAIRAVVLLLLLCRVEPAFRKPAVPDSVEIRAWLGYSVVLLGSSLVGFAFNMFDRLLIAASLPLSAMGRYDLANKPMNGLRMGFSVLLSAIGPVATRSFHARGPASVRRLFNQTSFFISAVLVPVFVTSIVCMDGILRLWLGDIGESLANLARAAAVFLLFNIHSSLANIMLVAIGKARALLPLQVCSALLALVVMALSVPSYGLYGCVAGVLAGYLLGGLLMVGQFGRTVRYSLLRMCRVVFPRYIAITAISAICAFLLDGLMASVIARLPMMVIGQFGMTIASSYLMIFWLVFRGMERSQAIGTYNLMVQDR